MYLGCLLYTSIQSTTADIEDLSENASFMKKCSQDSYTSMENLLEVNQQTIRNIEVMYQQTEYTNESVNKISEAATLISQIASQTNLLSLNASIEMCIRDRIGVLADSLNVAQGGISGLVSHVGETSEHLNLAEQQFVDNFGIMNEAIENLTNAMGDVAQNISQQAEYTTDVAGSVEKIAQNIQSTTADIEDLSENASFMKKCSQDSYTSMENLLEVNQQTIRNIEVMYQQTEYTNCLLYTSYEACRNIC